MGRRVGWWVMGDKWSAGWGVETVGDTVSHRKRACRRPELGWTEVETEVGVGVRDLERGGQCVGF